MSEKDANDSMFNSVNPRPTWIHPSRRKQRQKQFDTVALVAIGVLVAVWGFVVIYSVAQIIRNW